ncbi:MAG TPA: HAMP domain-containing sensor histidine kinase [Pyrinomonadaceae bacterium]|jgi:signal transduction histidine kinase
MTATESMREAAGFAVRCAADGRVLEIVSHEAPMNKEISVGASFFELVDPASRQKAEAFWSLLRARKAAFGWELNVAGGRGAVESMHFAGASANDPAAASDETYLIVAARSRAAVSRVYNDLMRLNNEQTNSLRAALKDLSLQMREQTERDHYFYDELSRLNNELTTAQRELAKKNAELARLNEQKNQFLGIASHDLRNPLEVIRTYSEFLLEDAAQVLEEEQIGFVRKIHSSSDYMLNLVNDFLDFSKIEAGRLELDLAPVDLVELSEKVIERSRVIADKKQIEIAFRAAEDSPEMSADESKIEQVLSNLVGNAIKFSPAGGRVEVTIETNGDRIVLAVKDGGPGISREEAETIFAPFVKGRNKATAGEKSAGLGLAIVKKIVEGHGGAISVETETNRGTTFYVSLPLKI